MILSDREIRAALIRQAIRITLDPQLDPHVWSSTALDLHLHERLGRWAFPAGKEVLLRPAASDFDFKAMLQQSEENVAISAEGLAVRHGESYLGWTIEQ